MSCVQPAQRQLPTRKATREDIDGIRSAMPRRDGHITGRELMRALQHMDGDWKETELKELLTWADDQGNGHIDYRDFVSRLFEEEVQFTQLAPGAAAGRRIKGEAHDKMKIAVFSAAAYVREFMQPLLSRFPGSFFVEEFCNASTAHRCEGANAVCLFVNDDASRSVLEEFRLKGVRVVLLRCAGFDRVDMHAAQEFGMTVLRVPAYSPYAVAEHAVSLVMTLNRRLHVALNRVRAGNYQLSGLVGFDMNGKTCGIVGTGKIGQIAAGLFQGFGMRIICYDPVRSEAMTLMGCEYVELNEVYKQADVISLHLPLLPQTRRMINHDAIKEMKPGVTIVNVSRGGIIDTQALIDGLSSGKIRAAGLDVYEYEDDKFFRDLSSQSTTSRMKTWDRQFALLRSFHNVLITPHLAFLTEEALNNILCTTIQNAEEFAASLPELTNRVRLPLSSSAQSAAGEPRVVSASNGNNLGIAKRVYASLIPDVAEAVNGEKTSDFRVAIFSSTAYVRKQMKELVNRYPASWFIEASCRKYTAHLCAGADAVCLFVNDDGDKEVLDVFRAHGVKLILLRCAGHDRVDLEAAAAVGIRVANVPSYSPHAVAEHAAAMALSLNRHTCTAYNRVAAGNFTLCGLVGRDLHGKTCGILGTGKIGRVAAKIFKGLGMEVLAFDAKPDGNFANELGCRYTEIDELLARADVLSLHMPLLPTTKHLIDEVAVGKMKEGVLLINVSRGAIVKTEAIIEGLLSGKIRGAGLDVYEHERHVFFKNFSDMDFVEHASGVDHDLMLLQSMPNVILTPHMAFLTEEALATICVQTVDNISDFLAQRALRNELHANMR